MSVIVNCKSENTQFWNRNELTLSYFEDIKRFPVLSIEEEQELLKQFKNGSKQESESALHRLVECNQRFVVSVARRWSTQENLMDIVNEANLGLIKAIHCFDLDKKQRLITYAVFWIRKYITNYVCSTAKMVKHVNAHKVFTYVNKIVNMFFAENGRTPYPEEIQTILKDEYNIILSNKEDVAQFTVSSIDAKYGYDDDDDSNTMAESGLFAMSTSSDNITAEIESLSIKHLVSSILSLLKPREQDIIKRYYGIGCDEETLESIGERHNLTRERCRQIVNTVIEKLKNTLIEKNIK